MHAENPPHFLLERAHTTLDSVWERVCHYSVWVKDNAHHKVESSIGRTCHPRLLARIWMAAYAKMDVARMMILKNVVVSRIQDAHAFIDRLVGEDTTDEASLTRKVTSKGGSGSISKES